MSRFVFSMFRRFCKRVCIIPSYPCTCITCICDEALLCTDFCTLGHTWGMYKKYPLKICHDIVGWGLQLGKTRPLESWRASCGAQMVEACKALKGTSSARLCRLTLIFTSFSGQFLQGGILKTSGSHCYSELP